MNQKDISMLEGVIHPNAEDAKKVENIVKQFLNNRNKIWSKDTWRKWAMDAFGLTDLVPIGYHDIRTLNKLLPRWVMFDIFMGEKDDDGAYNFVKDVIFLNPRFIVNAKKKPGSKDWDLDEMMSVLGHELIHREQNRRYKKRPPIVSADKHGVKKYLNSNQEMGPWAYHTIYDFIKAHPNTEFGEVVYHLKHSPSVKKFLSMYDRENKKRILRYMLLYAKKLIDNQRP